MQAKVVATLGQELYYTEVVAGTNTLITDEPIDLGGGNKGFNPFEVLATSLASCTAATLKMYMDRKQWIVDQIKVEVEAFQEDGITKFNRSIVFEGGSLGEEEKKRLLIIANKCPIHKVLTGENQIETELK
ncbi:MAG: OsmC family protein [Flavobacteriaceae bacterium]|jgi:putative redox protein|nr:OsmC family protein [Flavobacteriaceae bacterium]